MSNRAAAMFLVALAGCATPPTPAERAKAFEARLEYMVTTFGPSCDVLFKQTEKEWSECIVREADRDERQRAARGRAVGNALQNFGNTVYGPDATKARQIPITPAPVYTPPPTITCRTFGTTTTCN